MKPAGEGAYFMALISLRSTVLAILNAALPATAGVHLRDNGQLVTHSPGKPNASPGQCFPTNSPATDRQARVHLIAINVLANYVLSEKGLGSISVKWKSRIHLVNTRKVTFTRIYFGTCGMAIKGVMSRGDLSPQHGGVNGADPPPPNICSEWSIS